MKDFYLEPYTTIVNSLDDIAETTSAQRFVFKQDTMQVANLDQLKQLTKAFIISEPGYGKSRLMAGLADQIADQTAVIRVDCKVLLDGRLHLEEQLKDHSTHLFFDGLDEVPPMQFLETLNLISHLITQHPGLNVLIACRTHYLKRWKAKLAPFSAFQYVVIQQFSDTHIRRYLEHFLSDEDTIELIIRNSTGASRDSVLKTPRYLEAFVRSVQEGQWSENDLQHINRVQIFEKVIYYKLTADIQHQQELLAQADQVSANNDPAVVAIWSYLKRNGPYGVQANEFLITQRVLEKLALIMEIYQRNRISQQELVTYLDETQANINQLFLKQNSIDVFIERTLKKADFDHLEFEHTELQEYLAAKELIRMSNSEQVLYDLILDQRLGIVTSSWYDVVQYAIELDADKVAGSLANLLADKPGQRVEDRLIDLLLGPGMEQATPESKGKVFQVLFHYFQYSGQYLYQKDFLLASLYVPHQNEAVTALIELEDHSQLAITQFINRALIIRQLAIKGQLSPEQTSAWKTYSLSLLTLPQLREKYSDIFYVLEILDAKAELLALYPLMKARRDSVLETYLNSLANVAPDEGLPILIDVLRTRPKVEGKARFVDHLKTPAAISQVFALLLAEPGLIDPLFGDNWSPVAFYSLFDQLKTSKDPSLKAQLESLFQLIAGEDTYQYFSGPKAEFMKRAISYLWSDATFFARWLQMPAYENLLRQLAEPIAGLVTLAQFREMVQHARNSSLGTYDLHQLVAALKRNGNYQRKPVIKAIAEENPRLFADPVKDPAKEAAEKAIKQRQLYQEFLLRLMPGKKAYREDVFAYFLMKYEDLQALIQPKHEKKLKQLVANAIDNISPDDFEVSRTRQKSSVDIHTTNKWWYQFGLYLRCALLLKETAVLERNRSKIIKYLPLLKDYRGDDQFIVEHVMAHLGIITAADEEILLTYCTGRSDDYLYDSVSVFAELIEKHRLTALKPLLQQIIASPKPDVYEKNNALNAFGSLPEPSDQAYLHAIFADFEPGVPEKKQLGETANELLIRHFHDRAAIQWRFDQLRSRLLVLPEESEGRRGLRPYPDWEQELDRPQFGNSLFERHDAETRQQMILLLRFALETRQHKGHNRYSNYLLQIVHRYFEKNNNLKEINTLRAILAEPGFKGTAGAFKSYLVKLETHLSSNFIRYRTISEAIQIYNQLIATRYLPVYNHLELAGVVDQGITELESFITNKGFSQTAMQLSGSRPAKRTQLFNEDVLQKTLAVTLENSLLKQGLRHSDIHREIELNDGQRIDLLIKYGFIGPVMAELKLLHNPEIQNDNERAGYKAKLIKYIAGIQAKYAYYLVFKVRTARPKDLANFEKLVAEYSDIPHLQIKLLDCTG